MGLHEIFLTVLLVCVHTRCCFSWNADAGIIESLTKQPNVKVTATSHNDTVARVLDDDDHTNWVSDYCLPGNYMHNKESNLLLGICAQGLCTSTDPNIQNIAAVTDGDVYKMANAHARSASGGVVKLSIPVSQSTSFRVLTVNGVFHDANTKLYIYDEHNSKHLIRTFGTQDNYKNIEMFAINVTVSKVEIESHSDFSIKQIAAMGPKGCIQQIVVDLGKVSRVGTIRTRHWAGTHDAEALYLKTSVDGTGWTTWTALDPDALRPITTTIIPSDIRYIALEYHVVLDQHYKKVYCYEMDAWDEHGRFGPPLPAVPQTKTMRDIMGVNGIWGWGHSTYSNTLSQGQGPTLYNAVASHARNYHNLDWDVKDPDNDPGFTNMSAGHGTNGKWWLNWDTEYRAWKAANLYVDASVQFTNKAFPQSEWNTPEQSAYNYGHAFAKHFGKDTHLVDAIEVGNEPWDYDAGFYATVLKGMAAGVRSGYGNMTILPAAFQAHDKSDTGNYIGTRVLPEVANNIDVINSHSYSFYNTPKGVRVSTYPEDKQSVFNTFRSILRWRNANTPGKPVWITEWGWDSDGGNEDCTFPECTSELGQAMYGVRALMILARSGIERATWFFYANSDCNTLFCRSGLTTSKIHNFAKKTAFLAFEEILSLIGDKYFLGVLQENETGYAYLFGDQTLPSTASDSTILSKASYLVAWLPLVIESQQLHDLSVTLPQGVHVGSAVILTGNTHGAQSQPYHRISVKGSKVTLGLTSYPIIVSLVHGDGSAVVGK